MFPTLTESIALVEDAVQERALQLDRANRPPDHINGGALDDATREEIRKLELAWARIRLELDPSEGGV